MTTPTQMMRDAIYDAVVKTAEPGDETARMLTWCEEWVEREIDSQMVPPRQAAREAVRAYREAQR